MSAALGAERWCRMRIATPPACEFFGKRDAASYCALSERTLDTARATGHLPFYRFSVRKVLFRRSDLDTWLAKMRIEVSP